MAKRATTTRKPAAKKAPAAKPSETAAAATEDKAAPGPDAAATNEIPAASGAEAKPEGAAAPEGGTDAKVSENENSSGAADLAGTDTAPAAGSEESREQAEAAPADRKGAAEEGKEPEATARPPVAGPVLVVTGPRKGFRRGGFAFGAEPVELTPTDFLPEGVDDGDREAAAERFLAILLEPALTCVIRLPDGTEIQPTAADREQLRSLVAAAENAAEGTAAAMDLVERLLSEGADA